MKVIISDFDFSVPEEIAEIIGCDTFDDEAFVREDSRFINWVENNPEEDFSIVEIPDNATDYDIFYEEDGSEYIVAVIDGKLVYYF